jgi:hypothetical protein
MAQLLLDHNARIDARDEDHDSTPAQWLSGEAPDVARFLLDPRYESTPLGVAMYDCLVEKRHPEGEFGRVAKSLIEGAVPGTLA